MQSQGKLLLGDLLLHEGLLTQDHVTHAWVFGLPVVTG
jgi:hypothetical protein